MGGTIPYSVVLEVGDPVAVVVELASVPAGELVNPQVGLDLAMLFTKLMVTKLV